MTTPPFPVPRGMDWDPVKKRFFKKIPAKAKIESPPIPLDKRKKDREEKFSAQLPPISTSVFTGSHSSSLAHRALTEVFATRRSFPGHSIAKRRRQAVVESSLGQLKHVGTTTLIPWRLRGMAPILQLDNWDIRIRNLYSNSSLGAMIFFSNGHGRVHYLDTSSIVSREESSALLSRAICTYPGSSVETDRQAVSEFGLGELKSFSDFSLPCRDLSASPVISAIGDGYIARQMGTNLLVKRFARTNEGRFLQMSYDRLFEPKTKEDVQHLCLRVLPVRDHSLGDTQLLIAFASRRQVGILSLQHDLVPTGGSDGKASLRKMESDIICIELLPSGTTLLAGLRNGTIVGINVKSLLKRSSDQLQPDYRIFHLGIGAVTHINAISSQEAIVAYTSGEMFLIHPENGSSPLINFQGHVNSWSLDLPMAIDVEHRIFAIAGQDRKVRIWSLDHPLPLQSKHCSADEDDALDLSSGLLSTKTLQETTFSAPISGLTFCQRRYVANLEAKYHHLPRGLPALAISCHGNEIAFFE